MYRAEPPASGAASQLVGASYMDRKDRGHWRAKWQQAAAKVAPRVRLSVWKPVSSGRSTPVAYYWFPGEGTHWDPLDGLVRAEDWIPPTSVSKKAPRTSKGWLVHEDEDVDEVDEVEELGGIAARVLHTWPCYSEKRQRTTQPARERREPPRQKPVRQDDELIEELRRKQETNEMWLRWV